MLLQVHDELVVEAPEDAVAEVAALTRSVMEGVGELRVPLQVDVSVGASLADAKG
jgi:DNA polymerase-1